MTITVPGARHPIGGGILLDEVWFRYLRDLSKQSNTVTLDAATLDQAIAAINAELGAIEQVDLSAITITGTNTVSVTGSLKTGLVEIGGTPLEDSGTGALLGITRDSFGRVSGTTDATITAPAAGITVTNGDAVAGPPTLGLANDLAAVEGLSGTGIAARTASDTWATRTITGTADRVSLTDGDGVAGNPTIDIAATYVGQASIITLGTIGTGTWQATAVGLAYGGTGADYSSVAQNLVWASPNGSAGAPTFRSLVAGDIPDLSGTYQPLDATLTAFAALTIAADSLTIGAGVDAFSQTTFAANTFPAKASTGSLVAKSISDFGLSLVDDANAAAARTTLGLVIGTDVQAYDADLTTWAGLTPSANAQSLVTAADYAAMRALLDLEAGTDFYSIAAADAAFQPLDGELTALAGLTSAADALPYFTGAGTASTTTLTSFARTLLDDTDATTARSTLGLVIGTNVQAWDATLDTVAAWPLTGTANNTTMLRGDGVWSNWINGPFGIGGAPLSTAAFHSTKTITGSTTAHSIVSQSEIQSDVTGTANIFYSLPKTKAAAFTLTNLIHFRSDQSTVGAGSAITNQYAFRVESTLTGGANNFGVWSNIPSGSGRWNAFYAGTADNATAGNSKFGSAATPAAKVDIAAGSATAGTAPLKFTSGTVLSAAVAGVMEYDGDLHFTKSDATRRYVPLAPNATKTTAGAPYANDGYITIHINGTDFKVMTTA